MEAKPNTTQEEQKKGELPVVQTAGKSPADIMKEEAAVLHKLWSADAIIVEEQSEAQSVRQIKVAIAFSRNKHLNVNFIYSDTASEDYPSSQIAIRLKSKVMPAKLVETLQKKSEAMAEKLAQEKKAQLIPAFDFLKGILENNNLIPAWDELPEIRQLLRLKKPKEEAKAGAVYDELKLFEKAGKLRIKSFAQRGKFFLDYELVVPANYPMEKPTLKFIDHNFDKNFANIFYQNAVQVIQRLCEGKDGGYHTGAAKLAHQAKIGPKKNQGVQQTQMDSMKVLSRAEAKHDIDFMNKAQELRQMKADGDKGAKKYMKLVMKHENKYEGEMKAQEDEIQRIKDLNDGLFEESRANKSLFEVTNFLVMYFVRFLPSAKCLGCGEPLVCKLKKDPKVDLKRPERSYCGHWMHYECFEQFVNEPPFIRVCPMEGCGENFGSKNFLLDPSHVKSREKVYMQTEQKQGEETDLEKLLGI